MSNAAVGDDSRLGVNVIGFLDDALGLAQAARLYIAALRAAAVPVATTAIAPDGPAAWAASPSTATAGGVTMSCGRRSSPRSIWPA